MNRISARHFTEEALSLLEVLVAIAVGAVLIAMLFPFTTCGERNPRGMKAEQDAREIVHAVEQYFVEYEQYPNLTPTTDTSAPRRSADQSAGDSAAGMKVHNAALFNILRDIDRPPNSGHVQNPRNFVFVQGKAVSNPKAPKNGFLETASGAYSEGSWYDPWGLEYNIVIDSNGDGVINVDDYYEDFKGLNALRVKVGAFSLGKDQKLGKGGDRKYKNGADYSDDRLSWGTP